jgi:ketosteroid isomerase-like protein
MSSDAEALVQRAIQAWNADDWDGLEAIARPDVVAIGPREWPETGSRNGWPEVRDQFERLKDPWDSERFEVVSIDDTPSGALLEGRWVAKGTGSGLDLDMPIWIYLEASGGLIALMQFFLAKDQATDAARLGSG